MAGLDLRGKQECSFLKKGAACGAKTGNLLFLIGAYLSGHGQKIKVFCFFSSEKKIFLPFSGQYHVSCSFHRSRQHGRTDGCQPFARGSLCAWFRCVGGLR
jgi:hypothetical protein